MVLSPRALNALSIYLRCERQHVTPEFVAAYIGQIHLSFDSELFADIVLWLEGNGYTVTEPDPPPAARFTATKTR
jgi:PKD repeat protein